MSDTPRTDEELVEMRTGHGPVFTKTKWVHSSLCFKLELELNAANADVERLTKANFQLREGCEGLKQRIKRLEEAGDELAGKHLFAVHTYDNAKKHVAEWYKSKEGNP